jgi:hypothetical protein
MTILFIRDLIDSRARKVRELAFYSDKKLELERRLFNLRQEINLTDTILAMIRREELLEIGKS